MSVSLLQVRSRLAAAKESPEPSSLYFQSTNSIVPPTTHSQPSSTRQRRNGAGDERSRSEHFPEALSRMSSFSAISSSPSATRMAGVFPPLSVTLRSTPASQKLSDSDILGEKRGLSQTILDSPSSRAFRMILGIRSPGLDQCLQHFRCPVLECHQDRRAAPLIGRTQVGACLSQGIRKPTEAPKKRRKAPKRGASWRNFSAAVWPRKAAKCAAVHPPSESTSAFKSDPASARSQPFRKTSPLLYSESNLKLQLGLTVRCEGRHVALLGSLLQGNRWRLPP